MSTYWVPGIISLPPHISLRGWAWEMMVVLSASTTPDSEAHHWPPAPAVAVPKD